KNPAEMACPPRHAVDIEKIGAELQESADSRTVAELQRHIDAGNVQREGLTSGLHASQPDACLRLKAEHRLEHRCPAEIADGLQKLHDAFERHVLIRVGVE